MARTRSYSTVETSPLASFSAGALTVSVLVGILFFVVNFPSRLFSLRSLTPRSFSCCS